jgi:serine protease Do
MFPTQLRKLRFGLRTVFVLIFGIAIGFAISKFSVPVSGNNSKALQLFGMNLSEEPSATFNRASIRYRGGMQVNSVRPHSPAAEQGIVPGDILVGLHHWETASNKGLSTLVSQPQIKRAGKIKFHILRGKDTLYGYLNVADANLN